MARAAPVLGAVPAAAWAWHYGAIATLAALVVGAVLTAGMWVWTAIADVLRLEPDGLCFARGDKLVANVPWLALERVVRRHGNPPQLLWHHAGGRVRTWDGFVDEHALMAELDRRAPSLSAMPGG